jgi:hypothetical protein
MFGDMSADVTIRAYRKVRFLLLLVACSVAGGAIWYFFGIDHALRFDPTVWKRDNATYEQIYDATRDRMVDDLLRRHHLVGMSRAEVTALLGEPDYSRAQPFPESDMIYWLGPDDRGPMGHLDSLWLVMQCDTNGTVVRCGKTCD